MTAFRVGVTTASLCVLALQAQPTPGPLTVIVDVDTPVTDRALATGLLEAVLGVYEAAAPPAYQVLRGTSLRAIDVEERESFRRGPFDISVPGGGGVILAFAEAVEVARGNVSLRAMVLERECRRATVRGACAIDIDEAARITIESVEAATLAKLRRVVAAAASAGGAVVVASAGLTCRGGQLPLTREAEALRARGVRLVVLQLPSTVRYEGLVHDALEELATRLSAPVVRLDSDESAANARRVLGGIAPIPLLAVPLPDLAGPWPVSDGALAPDDALAGKGGDEVFARATAYVARFEQSFSSVIWKERYEQESRYRVKFGSSGGHFWRVTEKKTLDAELFLVWLRKDASWIAVRDVVAVDGEPRPASERKLSAVLKAETIAVKRLEELAVENGRFNIGTIAHTFNEPTLAMLLLDRQYRQRFAFRRSGTRSVNGRHAVVYTFREVASPTVIRNRGRDVPMSGAVTVDAAIGDVLETSIDLVDPSERLRGSMVVRFAAHPQFDVLVPMEMREKYTSPAGEEITTVATYSDFRRFETRARIIVP